MSESTASRLAGARALWRDGDKDQAVNLVRSILADNPDNASAHLMLGELLGATGNIEQAEQCFRSAARLAPQNPVPLHNLAICAHARSDTAAAMRQLNAALQRRPEYAPSLQLLGDLSRASGDYVTALQNYQSLVRVQPSSDNLLRLGATHQLIGDYDAAIDIYRRVLDIQPHQPDATVNLAICHQVLGQLDTAESLLREVLQKKPDHYPAAAALATVHDRRGQYDQSLAILQPLLASAGANADIWVNYARSAQHAGKAGGAVAAVEDAMQRENFTPPDRSRVAFAAGALRDTLHDYDRAFGHFQLANRLKPRSYRRAALESGVQRMLETFAAHDGAQIDNNASNDARPVFVIGMPRSGSTLIEHILAAHPEVVSIGESPALAHTAERLINAGYPAAGDRDAIAGAVRDYLDTFPVGGARVVDKTLSNFVYLGLIVTLFPNARIVHSERHPLDIVLSCYSHDFAGMQIGFTYDPDDIAQYYRVYRRTMAHWAQTGKVPLLTIPYESLVTHPEETTRALLRHVGVAFDRRCLRFHEQDRASSTASHAQVRRPVYRDSMYRYRHYRHHLNQVAEALATEIRDYEERVGPVDGS